MMVSEKIRLFPTPDQETKFKQFAGAARFVYNYALGLKIEYYREYNESLTTQNLIDFVKSLKYETERYAWLLDVPEAITKQAIKDLDTAYKNFFKRGNIGFPKFKKKGKCTESFYQRTDNFRQVDSEHIKLTGIKEFVRIRPNNIVFPANNPRVSFDGKYWYLSYSFEAEEHKPNLGGATIGVDLGIKKLAVRSDGVEVKNINNSPRVKTLEKRLKHLQRQVSRKYEQNKNKGGDYKGDKSKNIIKLEKQIKLLHRKLKNIRNTHIHQATYDIVKTKPYRVVVEDLNIRGMMKNKHLSEKIAKQGLNKFVTYLEYKCKFYGVEFIKADRWYPSSKLCSCCGNKKINLSLSERVYVCDSCGLKIDRDFNASLNLAKYKIS